MEFTGMNSEHDLHGIQSPVIESSSAPKGMGMAGSTARLAAIETLFQLEKTRKPVSALFENIAKQYRVAGNDRQLAMKIIYGVLRNRDYLDRLLGIL